MRHKRSRFTFISPSSVRRVATAIALVAISACGGDDPSGPELPDALLGRYEMASFRGERLPFARNVQIPTLRTTEGWFEFSADSRCEYGFAITNDLTEVISQLRIACHYRVTGTALSIRVGNETDYDLNGSWTAARITFRDPVNDELVYVRP